MRRDEKRVAVRPAGRTSSDRMARKPPLGDSRLIGEKSLVMRDRVYGAQQPGNAFTFRNVAARSRRLGHVHHAGALVHRQQKDSDTGKPFVNLSRGGEAVENRHRNVQNYQIWTQLCDLFQGFQSVGSLSANFKAARLQNGSNTCTQRLMIVNYQDSQSTLSFPSLRGAAARFALLDYTVAFLGTIRWIPYRDPFTLNIAEEKFLF